MTNINKCIYNEVLCHEVDKIFVKL